VSSAISLVTMTRLCTYVVREDTGLAPNPFWGWCTLAVCTPNRMGVRLRTGDVIAGSLTKARGHAFLFAMIVDEVLDLDAYFHDRRFNKKKPDLRGDWMARCGDNFYSRGLNGWVQHKNPWHWGEQYKLRDTRHAVAFAGERFWYRGQLATALPMEFQRLFGGRGVRITRDADTVGAFVDWVARSIPEGVGGLPNDNPDLVGKAR